MRFNCHSHLFNFQSVFTAHTLDILLHRITEFNMPEIIENALVKEISRIIQGAGQYTDDEQLTRRIFKTIKKSDPYKKLLRELSENEKLELVNLNIDHVDNAAEDALRKGLNWIGKKLLKNDDDARQKSLTDMIDFVRIALLPSIRKVTDHLMDQMNSTEAIIALMMDITKDGSNPQLFENQIKDTTEMVLAYPGRIFPFVAVNTNRPNHFQIMEHALSNGFTGVKLYPSLGYDIDSPEMEKVYTWCEERYIPLLMHCTNLGFYYKNQFRNNSHPDIWKPVLQRHPDLIVCFGHFGGAENLTGNAIAPDSWTGKILQLMDTYDHVYADISYHTQPMDGGNKEKNYFSNIADLMKNDRYKNHLLFGTDYFLVRQRVQDKNYRQYYKKHLSEPLLKQLTMDNPPRFLGMDLNSPRANQALISYVKYIYTHKDKIENKVPAWLSAAVKSLYGNAARFPAPTLGPRWSWNHDAHYRTWSFMKQHMSDKQQELKFPATGKLRLRQLRFWNKEFEAVDIWKQKTQKLAEDMDAYFRANGAGLEAGWTRKKGIQKMSQLFNNGDCYLFELAADCDTIYHFKKEGE